MIDPKCSVEEYFVLMHNNEDMQRIWSVIVELRELT